VQDAGVGERVEEAVFIVDLAVIFFKVLEGFGLISSAPRRSLAIPISTAFL
jgi:hypothetical protein